MGLAFDPCQSWHCCCSPCGVGVVSSQCVGSMLIYLFKPLAFSRCFVVLIPALVPVLTVLFGDAKLNAVVGFSRVLLS